MKFIRAFCLFRHILALSKKDESLTKMISDKIIHAYIEDNKRESLIKVLSTLLNLIYKGETVKNMLPVEKLEDKINKFDDAEKLESIIENIFDLNSIKDIENILDS